MADCLTHSVLDRLEGGSLSAEEHVSVEAHLDACPACERLVADLLSLEPTHSAIAPGTMFGEYLVLARLGAGAMGTVYSAYDPKLDRRVALKVLHPEVAAADGSGRLLREAKALARLSHPNVVQAYDAGTCHGRPFLAMELVEGQTLAQWIREPHSTAEILEQFIAAGRGLAAAHGAGLVHRDFKPSNVLLGNDGRPRVTDFGLARAFESPATTTGVLRNDPLVSGLSGTPAYMAPELFLGEPPSPAADQYSFCVALAEALTGGLPSGRAKGRALPGWLDKAISRGLRKAPEDRHESVAALVELLSNGRTARRWLVATLLSFLALVGVVVGWSQQARPCTELPARMHSTWRPELAATLVSRFEGDSEPVAELAPRVVAALSAWSDRWLQRAMETCQSTHLTHTQSETTLELRMVCLEGQRHHLEAVVQSLAAATPEGRVRSLELVSSLPDLERCNDSAILGRRRPTTAQARAEAEQAAQRSADAQVLMARGQVHEALESARVAARLAEHSQDRWVLAESTLTLAELEFREGLTSGIDSARRAFLAAEEAGHSEIKGAAAAQLAAFIGRDPGHRPDAVFWVDVGRAVFAGRPNDTGLLGRLEFALSVTDFSEGNYDAALESGKRAAKALEQRYGTDAPLVGLSWRKLGHIAQALGRNDDARRFYESAIARQERALGREHPDVARTRNDLGMLLSILGSPELAAREHLAALRTFERLYGRVHVDVAISTSLWGMAMQDAGQLEEAERAERSALDVFEQVGASPDRLLGPALHNLGTIVARRGRHAEALVLLRRSLAIKETAGPNHPSLSSTLLGIGESLIALHDPEGARPHLLRALRIDEDHLGAQSPVLAWPLLGLAECDLQGHAVSRSLATVNRALALAESGDMEPDLVPRLRFLRARALRELQLPGAEVEGREALALTDRCGAWCTELAGDIHVWLSVRARPAK